MSMPLPSPREPAPGAADDEPPADMAGPTSAEAFGLGDRPSKSRRKKDSHDLQALGEALVEMPDKRLNDLGMPEILLDVSVTTGAPSPTRVDADRCSTSAS